MKHKNIDYLLRGRTLLLEVASDSIDYRTWVELSLLDELKPIYPFRTDNYAMLGNSTYSNYCEYDMAAFKLRKSSFLVSDIENDYDPSYDMVGDYIKLNTVDDLIKYLDENKLSIDDFIDSSHVDDYPL
ncbi:hypothetical protein [Citrobacter sp. wls827]|uniref:hypothetical protein n=1 Tax=Citrobacter sp. wls827 TaxID=2576414 RepID=UPI002017787F|nr:hypothetical protein [Citrobacter sp. wls827]